MTQHRGTTAERIVLVASSNHSCMERPFHRSVLTCLLTLVLLSSCFRRAAPDRDQCQAPAVGSCEGSVGGQDVTGPLDPESGWLSTEPSAACGDDPLVMVLSCSGHAFRARAVFPHDAAVVPACGWATDLPDAAPPLVSAPLFPKPVARGRTSGTVVATFADGSRVNVTYDFADETRCRGEEERVRAGLQTGLEAARITLDVLAGIAWVAQLPGAVFSSTGHGSGSSFSSGGHAVSHHGHHHHHH